MTDLCFDVEPIMHPRYLLVIAVALGLGACFTPRDFIECADQTSCGLAVGGQCLVNPATGHQFCAYPDSACPEGFRWSDYDVEDTISGTCVQPGRAPDAGVDAPPPVCADLGCTPLGTFCTDTGCACTPPGGMETECVRGPGADGGVDAPPRDGSTDGGLPSCTSLGCSPVSVFCNASGCVCTPPGGSETACTQ